MVLGFELRSPVPVTQGTFGFSIRLFVTFLSSGPEERRPHSHRVFHKHHLFDDLPNV